jgi:hypothetical protein
MPDNDTILGPNEEAKSKELLHEGGEDEIEEEVKQSNTQRSFNNFHTSSK